MSKAKLATLEFQIKRGIIDNESLDKDNENIVKKCIELCKGKKFEEAINYILPSLNFEWIWSNCDGDPVEIFETNEDINFSCDEKNSVIKIGEMDSNLVLTATVRFEVTVKKGVTFDEVSEWLDSNSAYSCGYVGWGWTYMGSDGDNVWITDLN